jgi:hypothetical protein
MGSGVRNRGAGVGTAAGLAELAPGGDSGVRWFGGRSGFAAAKLRVEIRPTIFREMKCVAKPRAERAALLIPGPWVLWQWVLRPLKRADAPNHSFFPSLATGATICRPLRGLNAKSPRCVRRGEAARRNPPNHFSRNEVRSEAARRKGRSPDSGPWVLWRRVLRPLKRARAPNHSFFPSLATGATVCRPLRGLNAKSPRLRLTRRSCASNSARPFFEK